MLKNIRTFIYNAQKVYNFKNSFINSDFVIFLTFELIIKVVL